MSNRKISELTSLTAVAGDDVLPIVDISETSNATKNKKITVSELLRSAPDGTAAAPAFSFESDDGNGVFLAGTDTVGISTGGTQRVTVDGSGNVVISGDLTVQGATTTVESQTVTIDDKNIELGSIATPTNTTADGGGITLKGATDKTLKWINSTGCWTFNQPMNFNDHVRIDSNGRVGIGDSSPSNALNVVGIADFDGIAGNTMSRLRIQPDESTKTAFLDARTASGNSQFAIKTGPQGSSTERFRIDGSGNVGIGTTSPATKLHLSESNSGDYASLILLSNSANTAADRTGIYGSSAPGTANPYRAGITFWPGAAGAMSFHTGNNTTPGAGEAMRLDHTGRLGLGTSSPATKLHISDSGAPELRIVDTTNNTTGFIRSVDNAVRVGSASAHRVEFHVNSDEKMRLTSSGALGLGVTSAVSPLHVYHATTDTVATFESGDSSVAVNLTAFDNSMQIATSSTDGLLKNNGAGSLRLFNNGSERLRLDSSGRLLVGTTSARDNLRAGVYGSVGQIETAGTNAFAFIQNASSPQPVRIVLAKQKSGSTGGNTAVVNSDNIGSLEFLGNDGTNFIQAAMINAAVDGTPGTNDMPGRLVFSTTANGASSPTERMRLTSDGRLALGSTSPDFKAQITATDTDALKLVRAGAGGGVKLRLQNGDTNTFDITHDGAENLTFTAGSNERMRITSSGNVGIGATPGSQEQLLVHGGGSSIYVPFARSDSKWITLHSGGTDPAIFCDTGGSLRFGHGNARNSFTTERMRIDSSGNVGIGDSAPSQKLNVAGNVMLEGGDQYLYLTNAGTGNSGIYVRGNTSGSYLRSHSTGIFTWEVTGSEKMRIDSSGRVGIGTSSPSEPLSVSKAVTTSANLLSLTGTSFGDGETIYQTFKRGSVHLAKIGLQASGAGQAGELVFETASSGTVSERLRIDSSGRLLVGTSSEIGNSLLQIQGNSSGGDKPGSVILSRSRTNFGANQDIGIVNFTDGNGNIYTQILAEADGSSGTDDYPGRLVFSTTADGASSPTERLRIDSSGIVSIQNELKVGANDAIATIRLMQGTVSPAQIQSDGDNSAGYLAFVTRRLGQNYERMRINSSGNVGIGTTAPSVPLTVNSTTDHSDIAIFHAGGGTPNRGLKISTFSNTNSNAGVEFDAQHNTGAFKFSTGGTERLRIDSSGRLLVGTSSSQNIPFPNNTSVPRQIQVDSFNYVGIGIVANAATSNSTRPATLTLSRTGSNSNRTTAVTNGSHLGAINFTGYSGGHRQAASIISVVDSGTVSNTSMPGRLVFSTSADGSSSPTERVRISSSGNVGIGATPNSDSQLHVKSGANDGNPVLRLEAATNNFLNFRQTGSVYDINVTAGDPLSFTIGSSEIARVTSNGLTFNGDTAAANALDDYEEGTWTPTVGTQGGTAYTLSTAVGNYTKIGNLVFVQFQCTFTAEGSGTISIISMPFSRKSGTNAVLNGFVTNGTTRKSVQYTNYTGNTVLARIDVGDSFVNYWSSKSEWAPTNSFFGSGCFIV